MKIIFGILCVCVSTFIGYLFSEKYVKRKNFYNSFYKFNSTYKNEVGFGQGSIKNILKKITNKDYFYLCLDCFFNNKEMTNNNYLTKEEWQYFIDYLNKLGITDVKGQLENTNKNDNYLLDKKASCDADLKKYRNLYIKLGLLVGLIIFIIIL